MRKLIDLVQGWFCSIAWEWFYASTSKKMHHKNCGVLATCKSGARKASGLLDATIILTTRLTHGSLLEGIPKEATR